MDIEFSLAENECILPDSFLGGDGSQMSKCILTEFHHICLISAEHNGRLVFWG